MKDNAEKIVSGILNVLDNPDVQAGYPDANGNTETTWCNRGANRIAENLGGDMSIFLDPRGINWTTANTMFQNAVKNAKEISDAEAQQEANDGGLVLAACYNSKGPGHVAIVCPSDDPFHSELGPLVGETGLKCRIIHSRLAFEKWGFEARFFVIPKK
ncbi:MAG: hypothetical protein LBU88_03790 [Treponema sp.]|jgi:hypothetical protein|nr:hypothetical protein [Treponema sp.]